MPRSKKARTPARAFCSLASRAQDPMILLQAMAMPGLPMMAARSERPIIDSE